MEKIKKIFITVESFVFLLMISSCATKVENYSLDVTDKSYTDSIYEYTFERVTDCIEANAIYKVQMGMDYSQRLKKLSSGYAVYIQDKTFIEPELGLRITINPDGTVSSPDNESVSGSALSDGRIMWSGLLIQNNQTVRITQTGLLLSTPESLRASSFFDGAYFTSKDDSAEKQKLVVEKGICIWESKELIENGILPTPMIIRPDGSFQSKFTLTTSMIMGNVASTAFSTENEINGTLAIDGSVIIKAYSSTSGVGALAGNDAPFVYSGEKTMSDENLFESGRISNPFYEPNFKPVASPLKNANAPDWYSINVYEDNGYIIACGVKAYSDKQIALAIAQAEAAGQISSLIAVTVSGGSTFLSAESSASDSVQNFHEAYDSVSAMNLPYKMRNSFYDESSGSAYVMIELLKSEAQKIMLK